MAEKFNLTTVTVLERSLPVEGYVNPRARKLRLRFQENYKGLIVTLPSRASIKQAVQFVHSVIPWIQKNMPASQDMIYLKPGSEISLMGSLPILLKHQAHPRLSAWEEENALTVHCPEGQFEEFLIHHLKKKLRQTLVKLVTQHCASVDMTYNRLYIRDSRSNWGCCSHKKNLSFSWRLIFAPLEVINYVVAHEVAHLLEMNHSEKFWSIVKKLCPSYAVHRRWLRSAKKIVI